MRGGESDKLSQIKFHHVISWVSSILNIRDLRVCSWWITNLHETQLSDRWCGGKCVATSLHKSSDIDRLFGSVTPHSISRNETINCISYLEIASERVSIASPVLRMSFKYIFHWQVDDQEAPGVHPFSKSLHNPRTWARYSRTVALWPKFVTLKPESMWIVDVEISDLNIRRWDE